MPVLMVSYDLRAPGRDYEELYQELKSHTSWCRPVESVWIVDTALSSSKFADRLIEHIDDNDKLIVLTVKTTNWTTFNLGARVVNWIRRHIAP